MTHAFNGVPQLALPQKAQSHSTNTALFTDVQPAKRDLSPARKSSDCRGAALLASAQGLIRAQPEFAQTNMGVNEVEKGAAGCVEIARCHADGQNLDGRALAYKGNASSEIGIFQVNGWIWIQQPHRRRKQDDHQRS
jgi:hypothetical protein